MQYVCADIHGQYELYIKLLETLKLRKKDKLYIIGDVIDRGPDGIKIFQDMINKDNIELFLGNHELMMLDYFAQNENKNIWFYGNNGGDKTLNQLKELSQEEQEEILNYVKNSWIQKYIQVDGIKYALHHSFFLPNRRGENVRFLEEENKTNIFDAVWNSPYRFWEYAEPELYLDGYIHITGHIPVQNFNYEKPPYYNDKIGKKLIDIDGGCALIPKGYHGGLYCMSLGKESDEYWITN